MIELSILCTYWELQDSRDQRVAPLEQVNMARKSPIGPGTPVGNEILQQYKNWKTSGFRPWGPEAGNINHYRSSDSYQIMKEGAFRTQALKIAAIALKEMPECDFEEYGNDDDDDKSLEEVIVSGTEGDVCNVEAKAENVAPSDSRESNPCISVNKNEAKQDSNDEDDGDYTFTSSAKESCSDDGLEGFDDIELGELQRSREPFLSPYPTGDKLLVIFPLDGNVLDHNANQFEFIEDNTAIRRWGKVPKERESCIALIGLGTEKQSKIGFSDVDLMVVDAEIKRRLKGNTYKRDENDDIWEIRATLQLPFKCNPQLYAKNGKVLSTFRMQSNGRGFSWGYFWLLAWAPPKPKPAKRIGGKLVTSLSKEESSIYTEKTYESEKRKVTKKSKT